MSSNGRPVRLPPMDWLKDHRSDIIEDLQEPVFDEDEPLPKGWFVRPECDHYGNRAFSVCKAPEDAVYLVDSVIQVYYTVPSAPWWKFWAWGAAKPYEERVRSAFDASQRRAYQLNQQVSEAMGLDSKIHEELLREKTRRPHE